MKIWATLYLYLYSRVIAIAQYSVGERNKITLFHIYRCPSDVSTIFFITDDKDRYRLWPVDHTNHVTQSQCKAVCPSFLSMRENRTSGPISLASFPGSGNTWVRHMLEQLTGTLTGSVYEPDYSLAQDFPAELHSPLCKVNDAPFYLALKSHFPLKTRNMQEVHINFHKAIVLIRKPLGSILSTYNIWMAMAKGKDMEIHSFWDSAANRTYVAEYVAFMAPKWLSFYEYYFGNITADGIVLNRTFTGSVFPIFYDGLKYQSRQNKYKIISNGQWCQWWQNFWENILTFLELDYYSGTAEGSFSSLFEECLLCNMDGNHRRRSTSDPDKKSKTKRVNSNNGNASNLLEDEQFLATLNNKLSYLGLNQKYNELENSFCAGRGGVLQSHLECAQWYLPHG